MAHGFFSSVSTTWKSYPYTEARSRYKSAIPLYRHKYFSPLTSITETTSLAASLIHSPLWLAVNTLLQAVKAVVHLIATALLLPITLAGLIIAPKSNFSAGLQANLSFTAANTLVAATTAIIGALATIASLFLKPLQITTNVLATVYEQAADSLKSCAHLCY